MPFISAKRADELEAEGIQVVRIPVPPTDGFMHYQGSPISRICNKMGLQKGTTAKEKVTCPDCLRQMKRTGR